MLLFEAVECVEVDRGFVQPGRLLEFTKRRLAKWLVVMWQKNEEEIDPDAIKSVTLKLKICKDGRVVKSSRWW